jgi:glucose/arabinose dehydrogenase
MKRRRGVTSFAFAGVSAAALALVLGATTGQAASPPPATGAEYNVQSSNFWLHPPDDWWRAGESEAMKGLVPIPGQPIPTSLADDQKIAGQLKVPPGFKVSVYMNGVPQARQMAWGDKGTLFVGSDVSGIVTAITTDANGKRTAKTVLKGFMHDTGVAFMDHTLYVADPWTIYAWQNPEDHLDSLGDLKDAKVVYSDFTHYGPHNWKILIPDPKDHALIVNVGAPCSLCIPPPDSGQMRKIYPANGMAELAAVGIRQVVGGAIDPRTDKLWFTENGSDWLGDDYPSDKLEYVGKWGANFGFPYCLEGDKPEAVYGKLHPCSDFTPPALNLGAHKAPIGMMFYQGHQFPSEYAWNIFIAEVGSWNRHTKTGYDVVRVIVDPDGKNAKEVPFVTGFNQGDTVLGRPDDVIQAPDGSILISDEQSSTIWQVSYVGTQAAAQ